MSLRPGIKPGFLYESMSQVSQGDGDFDSRDRTPVPVSRRPLSDITTSNTQEAKRKQKGGPHASVMTGPPSPCHTAKTVPVIGPISQPVPLIARGDCPPDRSGDRLDLEGVSDL